MGVFDIRGWEGLMGEGINGTSLGFYNILVASLQDWLPDFLNPKLEIKS